MEVGLSTRKILATDNTLIEDRGTLLPRLVEEAGIQRDDAGITHLLEVVVEEVALLAVQTAPVHLLSRLRLSSRLRKRDSDSHRRNSGLCLRLGFGLGLGLWLCHGGNVGLDERQGTLGTQGLHHLLDVAGEGHLYQEELALNLAIDCSSCQGGLEQ
jgi:hypothetical protein